MILHCFTCANYNFTIVILLIIILQFSSLHQFWFHNCYLRQLWFYFFRFGPILQLSCALHFTLLDCTFIRILPIIILQLSYLRHLWFYNCHTCVNYDFCIGHGNFVMVIFCANNWFYNCFTFTIFVILAPIMILHLSFGQLISQL